MYQVIFDVQDTSNYKVRFLSESVEQHQTKGSSTENQTWVEFIRLGDTIMADRNGRPNHIEDYCSSLHTGQWFGWSDATNKVYANLIIHDSSKTKPTEQECTDGLAQLQADYDQAITDSTNKKASAKQKLQDLGLTVDEIKEALVSNAIINNTNILSSDQVCNILINCRYLCFYWYCKWRYKCWNLDNLSINRYNKSRKFS